MPAYDITAPDGRKFRVTAPEGATQEQVLAYAQKNMGAGEQKPKEAPAQPPVEDPGMLGALGIGVGRGLDRLAAGARNSVRSVIGDRATEAIDKFGRSLGMADGSQIEAQQEAATSAYKPLSDLRPWATGIGEMVPAAVMTATAAGPAAMIAGSALPGLLEYGTPEERLMRGGAGAAGGALGAALGKGISAVLNPTKNAPARVPSSVLDAAKRIGYNPTAGQQSGAKSLQMLEQQAAKNPVSAGTAQAFNAANQTAINRAAAKAIGETADSLSEDVMASAAQRIGGQFDGVFAGKTIPVSNIVGGHAQVLARSVKNAGEFADPQVVSLAERAAEVAKRGTISGDEYQAMRSALTAIKRTAAASNNGPMKSASTGIIKALDDAAEKVIPKDEFAAFAKARGQYAAMKTLEKRGAIKGGNVDPAIVRNAMQSADRAAFARGSTPGQLADIASIGNHFRPLPDSGTASNLVTQLMLTGGAGLMGPQAMLASVAAPYLGGKALFSDAGRKYLANGLMNVTPELERKLIAAGALPGGLLGLQSSR